jgi:transcriptional regulator
VLIHPWDAAADEDEWRAFLAAHPFGQLVAAGRGRDLPVVVPTQYVLVGHELFIHLIRRNPIFDAVRENPHVMLSVTGDWVFVPSSWKALPGEDPRLGIPTTYYAAVQLAAVAEIVDGHDEVAAFLRTQLGHLQPDEDVVDPLEHGRRLSMISGLRARVTDVRAKFKYGGNVDRAHREAVLANLTERNGAGDRAAAAHLRRRLDAAPSGRDT